MVKKQLKQTIDYWSEVKKWTKRISALIIVSFIIEFKNRLACELLKNGFTVIL